MKDRNILRDLMSWGIAKFLKDESKIKMNVRIELFDENGALKEVREIHNTVTTAGKNAMVDQMLASPTFAKAGWMEVGTGTPSATLLGAYIAGSRTALTSKTRTDNVLSMVCTFGPAVGTGAITEMGVFNIATENTVDMLLSTSFGVVTKAATDSITVTWTWTLH